jgi:hypothetical protein
MRVKVYSPSSTQKWLTCPRLWSLEKEWRSKLATKRDVGAILGGGFARGMQTWYTEREPDQAISLPARAAYEGYEYAEEEIVKLGQQGIRAANQEVEDLLVTLPTVTESIILKYIAKDPIPTDWRILAVELEMGEEKCRLDLGVKDNNGPAIIDFKVKRKLEARYRAKTIEEYRYNPQQLHYCWRWSQVINEPVLRYYIVLVSLQPSFQASIHQFDVLAKTLQFWKDSYEHYWYIMGNDEIRASRGDGPPGNFNNCLTKFGPCEFQPACHEYHHDPLLMEVEYVRKVKVGQV